MVGDVAVVSLRGNFLGEPETTILRNIMYKLLEADTKKIVLDIGGVRQLNSSGLGAIISALTSARKKGGDLRIAEATERTEPLFVITRLVRIIKLYNTLDRAVSSFR